MAHRTVVIIFALAETVDDIAEVKKEQGYVLAFVGEIADHLVGDQVLVLRAAGAAGIAGRVKNKLPVGGDLLLQRGIGGVEHGSERQPRFRHTARRRKRQRMNLVLGVELVDFFVDRVVG